MIMAKILSPQIAKVDLAEKVFNELNIWVCVHTIYKFETVAKMWDTLWEFYLAFVTS